MAQLTLPLHQITEQWLWENFERTWPFRDCGRDEPTWVYTIMSKDGWLYIGCTASLLKRLRNHSEKFWWIDAIKVTAELICCRDHALEYEAHEILRCHPTRNKKLPTPSRHLSHEWVRHGTVGFDKEDF
jgi:hypothetical protein